MYDFERTKVDWTTADSPLLLGIVGADNKLKTVNCTWERLLGHPRATLLDKPLTLLVDQNEHALVLSLLNARYAAVDLGRIEFSLRCSDGRYRCFAWKRRRARAEEGMFITGHDAAEREKLETTANLHPYLEVVKAGRSG